MAEMPACAKIELARSIPAPPRPPLVVRGARALRDKGLSYAVRRVAEKAHLVDEQVAFEPAAKRIEWAPASEEALDLQPGELVEVKSAEEIRATLDEADRYRGLLFMSEMWKYAGQRFEVLQPMTTIISESTLRLHTGIKNTVLLAEANCDGADHGGCTAACYHMWREVWLRRVGPDA